MTKQEWKVLGIAYAFLIAAFGAGILVGYGVSSYQYAREEGERELNRMVGWEEKVIGEPVIENGEYLGIRRCPDGKTVKQVTTTTTSTSLAWVEGALREVAPQPTVPRGWR